MKAQVGLIVLALGLQFSLGNVGEATHPLLQTESPAESFRVHHQDPSDAYVSNERLAQFRKQYAERVYPVFTQADCTYWNQIANEPATGDDGEKITRTQWFIGTGFAWKGHQWLTAAHVVEGGFVPDLLWLGWQCEPTAYRVGHKAQHNATLIEASDGQALLRTPQFSLDVSPPPQADFAKLAPSQRVFHLGVTTMAQDGTAYVYRFVNKGSIRSVNPNFPSHDVVTNSGGVGGESGSLAFVSDGETFYAFGTLENSWTTSDKTGFYQLADWLDAPSDSLPDEAQWSNWSSLTESQRQAWTYAYRENLYLQFQDIRDKRLVISIKRGWNGESVGSLVVPFTSDWSYGAIQDVDVSDSELLRIEVEQ